MELAGRTVVMAGTRRIGRAIALRLGEAGCNVGVIFRSSEQEARTLVDDLRSVGAQAVAVQSTLITDEAVGAALDEIERTCGSIDALINLASGFERTPLPALDADAWDRNLAAARVDYLLSLHAARRMAANAGPTRGHILKFGDWAAGETPYRNYLPYLTAKAAITFMTRALAVELSQAPASWSTRSPPARRCARPTSLPTCGTARSWPARRCAASPASRTSSTSRCCCCAPRRSPGK